MVTPDLLAHHEVFASLPEEISKTIQRTAQIGPFAPGEVVVPAGQPFTFFGVLLEGEAEAYLPEQEGEPQSIEAFRAGDAFGELSLMTGTSSPVDVIATTPCRVLLIPVEVFQRWIQLDPDALRRFSRTVARRSMQIERGSSASPSCGRTENPPRIRTGST